MGLLLLIFSIPLWAQEIDLSPIQEGALKPYTETTQYDFPLRDLKTLMIYAPLAEVKITGTTHDRLTIKITKKMLTSSEAAAKAEFAEVSLSRLETPNRNEISLSHKRGADLLSRLQSRKNTKFQVEWEIRAPMTIPLEITGKNTQWRIHEWSGNFHGRLLGGQIYLSHLNSDQFHLTTQNVDVELKKSKINTGNLVASAKRVLLQNVKAGKSFHVDQQSGQARLEHTTGDFNIYSKTAEVSIDRYDGDLIAKNTSGTIRVTNISGAAEVHTESGLINIDWSVFKGKSWIETQSGNVQLTLPPDFSAKLDLFSLSGQVVVQFPVQNTVESRHQYGPDTPGKVSGTVGQGKYQLKVVSKSAPIRIIRSIKP